MNKPFPLYNGARRFDYDLRYDSPALINKIARYFGTDKVYKVDYFNFHGYVLEKLGIDYILMRNNEIITLQLKIRDNKYYMKDICVELYHKFPNKKKKGYIYTIKADYMVYAWLSRQRVNQHDSSNDDSDNNSVSNGINNNNNSNFNDIRAFMPNVLLINVTKLKRFFDKNKSQYNIVPTKGTRSRYT